jgi:hypothetical protein
VRDLAPPGLPGVRYAVVGPDRTVEVEVPASHRRLTVLGGTDRVASCSGVRPSHFISKVIR